MCLTLVALALLVVCSTSDAEAQSPFQGDELKVISVTYNHTARRAVRLNSAERKRIRLILMKGKPDPAIFIADYTLKIEYSHKREIVLVNGRHFKFKGETYLTDEEFGTVLSTTRK